VEPLADLILIIVVVYYRLLIVYQFCLFLMMDYPNLQCLWWWKAVFQPVICQHNVFGWLIW